ncbi:MAG: Imm42 family immunity protein [Bacteroidota bacterium]
MQTKEIIFGDKSTFAIRYVPGYIYKDNPDWIYAFLHFVLGGHVIGDIEESCAVEKSWLPSLELVKNNLIQNNYRHPEFANRTNDELFELVYKANQSESEFKSEYKHLPQLDSDVWSICCLRMDETTDAYLSALVEADNKLKFIWEGWRAPCPVDEINKRFSITVDKNFVIKTINECISYVVNDYKNYPKISSQADT